jgi:hypothetical protein
LWSRTRLMLGELLSGEPAILSISGKCGPSMLLFMVISDWPRVRQKLRSTSV